MPLMISPLFKYTQTNSIILIFSIQLHIHKILTFHIKLMLTFQEQQKILRPILDRQTNKSCADCGTHSPTWASLDFGVFVCSNCSGAHRALGPTITRIKSVKLDQWHKDWVENMRLGNQHINNFWEADSKTANIKKPHSGATLDEHNRYVYDKYMRKKFVTDKLEIDPLTASKKGQSPNNITQVNGEKPISHIQSHNQLFVPNIVEFPKKHSDSSIKNTNLNLLDDLSEPVQLNQIKNHHTSHHSISEKPNRSNQQQDEFSQFVGGNQFQNYQQPVQNPQKTNLSFDQLMKQPQLTSNHSQPVQPSININQQPQYYGYQNGFQGNLYNRINPQYSHGYSNAQYPYQQQPFINQFTHNPYIGYAPHNQLHASHNMNFTLN